MTPETSGVEEVVIAEICDSIPYSGPKVSQPYVKEKIFSQIKDNLKNEDMLKPVCEAIPAPLLAPIFRKPQIVDTKVRRSIRKRTRSVRAPSPESILRGSGSGPINPLLFHEEQNDKVKVECIETEEITSTVKENVQQNEQNDPKDLEVTDKNVPSSCSMPKKIEIDIQGM